MGCVKVETWETISGEGNEKSSMMGQDDYYVYCDNCGGWDIEMLFPASSQAAETAGLGCLGCFYLALLLFWPLIIVVIIIGLIDPELSFLPVSIPTLHCKSCNESWVGVLSGKARVVNYHYTQKDISAGVRSKAFLTHGYSEVERELEYYKGYNRGKPYDPSEWEEHIGDFGNITYRKKKR